MLRIFFLLIFSWCVVACSTITTEPQPGDMHLGFEYVDDRYQPIAHDGYPEHILIYFSVIPGGIFGPPQTQGLLYNPVSRDGSVIVDIDGLLERARQYATPLLANPGNDGITVSPAETRLLRFATFSLDAESGNYVGNTGIGTSDPEIKALILAYFDRPSKVTGSQQSELENIEFNIDIDSSGLVWMKLVEVAPNKMELSRYEPQGNEFIFVIPTSMPRGQEA